VLIGNPLIFMVIIARMGYGRRTSFLTSVTVAQISEFSFIFAGMGVSRGLIGAEILSITALVGVATIALSAYMILYNHELFRWCERLGITRWRIFRPPAGRPARTDDTHGPGWSGHVIVVGMNTLGRHIAALLQARGETVLAIDTDPAKLHDLAMPTLLGSVEFLPVLREAGLDRAKLLVSALRIEETNDLLAYRCQAAGVPCAVHVADLSMVDNLLDLGADYLMVPKVDGVKAQGKLLREMGVLKP
jgi:hypothetical protein